MDQPVPVKTRGFLKWVAVAVVAVLAVSIAAYLLLARTPDTSALDDIANDMQASVGTPYPGLIDVMNATLKANGTALSVTINVASPISSLSADEYAWWNVTVTLEDNGTMNKTYEICVELNGILLSGSIIDGDSLNSSACQAEYHANTLTVNASMSELPRATKAEWFILTTYEKYSETGLVAMAYDIAPEEGYLITTLGK